jgi:hypothetical protein
MTQQACQGHDAQNGKQEQQRVRIWLELCGCEHHGHEDQQPEEWVVADFSE